jgi:hypothetical protein
MRAQVAILAAFLLSASAAAAQPATNRAEPWRTPADQPGTRAAENRARVTSDTSATGPSPAEQKEARALAAAVFAKPAAAQRAVDKVAPEAAPEWAAVQPKAEWSDKGELVPGGRGVKVTTPF